jgi:predicted solute-binding protein
VYEVVNSLVCLAEGRSYSPSLLNRTVDNLSRIGFPLSVSGDMTTRRLLTAVVMTSKRTEIINYHAQIYAEYFLQVGGTNALRKECIVRYEEETTFRELSQESVG